MRAPATTLESICHYQLHFTKKETEAQTGNNWHTVSG